MEIRIGTFAKENNSTKQINVSGPTTTGFTNLEVQLKDNVSIHSPIILIDIDNYNAAWNYVYIYLWGRFYFIRESTITTGGIWEVQLVEDVLATWKTEIAASTCYVSRSASNGSDFLPDSAWSHTTDIYTSQTGIDIGMDSTGCYLLFTASDKSDSSGVPGCTCYVLSETQLANLIKFIFSSSFFDVATADITDAATSALAKTFFNPFQYILRCMWIPFTESQIPNSGDEAIHFGWWEADDPNVPSGQPHIIYSGKLVQADRIFTSHTFTVGSYTSWIDRDPNWSKYDLYLPGAGTISIPSDYAGQTLTLEMHFDIATGAVFYFVRNASFVIIASASGQIGCDVQLTALYKDFVSQGATGLIGSITKGFGGMVSGYIQGLKEMDTSDKSLRGALNAAGDVIGNTVKGTQAAMQPTASSVGSNGTKAGIKAVLEARLSVSTYHRYEDIHVPLGKVCNKVLQLGNLSGYTECVNPKVDIPGNSEEAAAINSFLTTGFYME